MAVIRAASFGGRPQLSGRGGATGRLGRRLRRRRSDGGAPLPTGGPHGGAARRPTGRRGDGCPHWCPRSNEGKPHHEGMDRTQRFPRRRAGDPRRDGRRGRVGPPRPRGDRPRRRRRRWTTGPDGPSATPRSANRSRSPTCVSSPSWESCSDGTIPTCPWCSTRAAISWSTSAGARSPPPTPPAGRSGRCRWVPPCTRSGADPLRAVHPANRCRSSSTGSTSRSCAPRWPTSPPFGTRHSTSTQFSTALGWAEDQLAALGYVTRREAITVRGKPSQNLVADMAGVGAEPRRLVVVVAHLDSVNVAGADAPAPGADDNGSGSGGLLEIARVLRDRSFTHDLRFVLFGGEEQGLHGSQQHVAALSTTERARIAAVLNMDMVAGLNTPKPTVLIEGSTDFTDLIDAVLDAAVTYTSLEVQTSTKPFNSDHVSFLDADIPAVLTIEGVDSANTRVHTADDTLEHVDHELAREIVRMNVAATATALQLTEPVPPQQPAPQPPVPAREPVAAQLSGRYTGNGGAGDRRDDGAGGRRLTPAERSNPLYALNRPVYINESPATTRAGVPAGGPRLHPAHRRRRHRPAGRGERLRRLRAAGSATSALHRKGELRLPRRQRPRRRRGGLPLHLARLHRRGGPPRAGDQRAGRGAAERRRHVRGHGPEPAFRSLPRHPAVDLLPRGPGRGGHRGPGPARRALPDDHPPGTAVVRPGREPHLGGGLRQGRHLHRPLPARQRHRDGGRRRQSAMERAGAPRRHGEPLERLRQRRPVEDVDLRGRAGRQRRPGRDHVRRGHRRAWRSRPPGDGDLHQVPALPHRGWRLTRRRTHPRRRPPSGSSSSTSCTKPATPSIWRTRSRKRSGRDGRLPRGCRSTTCPSPSPG